MRLFLFFASIFLSVLSLKSQALYVVSQRDVPLINKTFELNLNNCDSLVVLTCPPSNNTLQIPENQYSDIAVSDTIIYYTSGWGSLYSKSISNNTCTYLGGFNHVINALVADSLGVIYGAGQQNGVCKLLKYYAGTFTAIGDFPANFFSAGDLFFYENRLFMTGTNGDMSASYLIEVDKVNPSQSCSYMALQNYQPWAAFSIISGGTSKAYIFTSNGAVATSDLRELNMAQKTIGNIVCTYPFRINGAATYYQSTNGSALCNTISVSGMKQLADQVSYYFMVNNPVSRTVSIQTNIPSSDIKLVSLFDLSGKLLIIYSKEDLTNSIELPDLSNGLYMIQLTTQKGSVLSHKLIIKND